MLRIALRRLINVLIVFYLIALSALFYTGGYEFEIAGIQVSSNKSLSLVAGLAVVCLLRVFVSLRLADAMLLAGSLTIGLVLAEVAVRTWNPPIAKASLHHVHRASPTYGWELVPGSSGTGWLGEQIDVNSHG